MIGRLRLLPIDEDEFYRVFWSKDFFIVHREYQVRRGQINVHLGLVKRFP